MMINKEDYERFLGEDISMNLQTGEQVKMRLVEVSALSNKSNSSGSAEQGRHPFILVFHGPNEPRHHSGCVMAKWGSAEPVMLGLYGESSTEDRIVYSAVFN